MVDDLINAMRQIAGERDNEIVIAEIKISSTELHNIANGKCCVLNDGIFGIRFLLKNSFKSHKSDFVINNFVLQVIANGKKDVMRKETIAVQTKVVKRTNEKKTKETPKAIKFETEEINHSDLF